ncbi:MAG: malate synthase A, partial [Bacteroidota bacterium]
MQPPLTDRSNELADGVEINTFAWTPQARRLLTPDALALLARLHRALEPERQSLLMARKARQESFDNGARPGFLEPTEHPDARGDWQVAPLPEDLQMRRVEITGPVSDAKMVINMLSRTADGQRADCAMVDFEDSMKPSWNNVMQGVENVIGIAEGTLSAEKTDAMGVVVKRYQLDPADMALPMVRVRGLHLDESNLRIDGAPISGGLLDFALVAYHTAKTFIAKGTTPKFYVPKVEHYLEARWWNTLMDGIEDALGLERSTVRATFLIETLPAAYQMEEILYEIRTHAAGLNGGRWDKIFSDIKTLRAHADRVMADRATIGMNRDWMSNYAKQLIRVCH